MPTRKKAPLPYDDAYLQIWKIEQEHSRTRWTVTTLIGAAFSAKWLMIYFGLLYTLIVIALAWSSFSR
jgi:hypothetical protein